jgi:nucleoside-diphosphate-sugar epimerase
MAHEHASRAALILGCGYLGRRIATRLIEQGVTVFGSTRQPARAAQLAALGVRPLLVHVTQRLTFAALAPALAQPSLDVYYLIPPGRADAHTTPQQVVREGIANTLAALSRASIHRAVLASSTAVYGQSHGCDVDADTPAQPHDERARCLLDGEQHWLAQGSVARVVRLAGLYGPGRIIGLSSLRESAPIVGDPQAMLNLIHVDDAAELLVTIASSDTAATIELGCDGSPAPRIDYYRHLASLAGLPEPAVLDDERAARELGLSTERLRRSSSKVCRNDPTRKRTGWSPSYPDYRAGLVAAMRIPG